MCPFPWRKCWASEIAEEILILMLFIVDCGVGMHRLRRLHFSYNESHIKIRYLKAEASFHLDLNIFSANDIFVEDAISRTSASSFGRGPPIRDSLAIKVALVNEIYKIGWELKEYNVLREEIYNKYLVKYLVSK